MLDRFLVLLERFVVAHELIAANSAANTIKIAASNIEQFHENTKPKELPVEGESVIDTPAAEEKPKRKKPAKPAPEADDLADEPAPEEKKAAKKAVDLADEEQQEKKPPKKEVDLTPLRDEIKQIAKHIAAGESDKCADLFDELLEEYGVRTVTKLSDEDVVKFHTDAKTLVAKYYDVEED